MAELDRMTLQGDGTSHTQFTDSRPLDTRDELAEIERRHLIAAFLERLGYTAAAHTLRFGVHGYTEIAAGAYPTCDEAVEVVQAAVRDAFEDGLPQVIFVTQTIKGI